MAPEQLEREDKYDVPDDFVVPELSAVVPDGTVAMHTDQLEATYFDTAAGHLRQHSITLRRRRGGRDAGWHLKLPAATGRTEITVDSPASRPPRELSSLLLGIRRGEPLGAQARLSTRRQSVVLRDGAGRSLAEVVDDSVHAVALDDQASVTDWRELEVELGHDVDEAVLAHVGDVVLRAGATPAAIGSKYARAMGPARRHRRPDGLAGVVDDYLQAQYTAIAEGDLGLRRDTNVIHPTRVAIRRLRSTLRVFAVLFDSVEVERFEPELAWYAGVLGAVRDVDVQRARLAEQVAALPPEYVLGPVAADLDAALAAERTAARRKVRSAMDGRRYRAMLTQLETWRTDPPFTRIGAQKPQRVACFVADAGKNLRKRLRQAANHETDDELFHRARKAAKRYRYANELAEPLVGEQATAAIDETKELQTLLGEHQDSVVSAELLRRLGASPAANGFTYGVLLGQQLQRSAETRAGIVLTWRGK